MTAQTEEIVDLESLFDTTAKCTSRAQHNCSEEATHACRATFPCPDAVFAVQWCAARFNLYLKAVRYEMVCTFCRRPVADCWKVWPI